MIDPTIDGGSTVTIIRIMSIVDDNASTPTESVNETANVMIYIYTISNILMIQAIFGDDSEMMIICTPSSRH